MILVIDVGNTNITYGVYEKGKMKATFRATTKLPRRPMNTVFCCIACFP